MPHLLQKMSHPSSLLNSKIVIGVEDFGEIVDAENAMVGSLKEGAACVLVQESG